MRNLASLAGVLILLSAGCGSDEPPSAAESDSLRAFILALSTTPTPKAETPTLVDSETSTEVMDDAINVCVYRRFEGTALYETLVSFDPNADALWPGSTVQSQDLERGLIAPIGLPRAPGTITLTNAVLDDEEAVSHSREVAEPSLASIQDAIADILSVEEIDVAAKASYVSEQVHSLDEAALKAGLSVDWMAGSVSADFEGAWTEERTTHVVRFVQNYYTVSFASPSSPERVFQSGVSVDDARPYMGDGNLPGYVSTVTYGRMLLLKIESSYSASELKGAIDAAFSMGVTNVEASVSAENQQILSEASVTAFALGGDPSSVADTIAPTTDRVEAMRRYFSQGAEFSASSPGVPIGYSVRHLADNKTVTVASSVDYEVPSCGIASQNLLIHLDRFDVIKDGDGGFNGPGEIAYTIWVDDEVVDSGSASAGNGDVISLNQDVLLMRAQRNGENFMVRAELTESGAKNIYPNQGHTFILDGATATGEWTQTGPNQASGAEGNFEVVLRYTFERSASGP